MKRTRPASVFVPYEKLDSGLVVRSGAFPRFVEPQEVLAFLNSPQGKLRCQGRLLDWREEWEPDSINEYMRGVGEKEIEIPQLIRVIETKH